MAKQSGAFELTLPPQPAGATTYEWLYETLRSHILDGQLRPGTRLPSTRELAKRYGLARGTILNAFELLKSEGYLQGTVGSGTFVSEVLPDDLLTVKRDARTQHASRPARRHLSEYGKRVQHESNFEAKPMRAFRANLPAIDLFPFKKWSALAARRMRNADASLLIGCDAIGYAPLRNAVAAYLNAWRGVKCTADQVIVVSGVQEAIDITCRVLLDPGDSAAVEDPGYPGVSNVLHACGVRVLAIPVDEEGLTIDDVAMQGARAVFVTPAHQAPLGVTMSLRRRLALLEWAQRNEALIFEDDYDSEYRYSSRPVPALQGLDRGGNVIFSGSFNKVLFPSLRLGYVVAPPDLVDRFVAVKSITSRHAQLLDQAVLCDFITEGDFARHVRRMREVYAERLSVLLECVRERLAGAVEISGVEAGLQTMAWLAPGINSTVVAQKAGERGIRVNPLRDYARRPLKRDGLQLGFAAVGPAAIRHGVHELERVLRDLG
jgi:GntR family transcriptional regulator/MocR family aminotransferase